MDALLRRRLMMLGGGGPTPPPTPVPVFYDWLVFDGTAYIDTSILWPENGSMRCEMGRETVKATQRVFAAGNSSGLVGIVWGGGTNTTRRQVLPYYDSTSYLVSNYYFAFSYSTGGVFLTPKKVGYGNNNKTITKGSSRPSTALVIGNNYGHSGQSFTGSMKTFYIYGSDAQDVTSFAGFGSYTPVYTLRPCLYEEEAGFWCVETNTFYGNTAGAGSLSVSNT